MSGTVENNIGDGNVAIGYLTARGLSSGCHNVFLGSYAGNGTTTGSSNVFLGCSS